MSYWKQPCHSARTERTQAYGGQNTARVILNVNKLSSTGQGAGDCPNSPVAMRTILGGGTIMYAISTLNAGLAHGRTTTWSLRLRRRIGRATRHDTEPSPLASLRGLG